MRRGELSAAQAESISDAATHNPDAEQRLLATASRSSLAELRDECARLKTAGDPDPDTTYKRIHDNRYLRRRRDSEGAWNLIARGTPDAGAFFNSALDPIIDHIFHSAWAEGRREERQQYAFDALVEMARRARDGYHPHADDDDPDETETDGDAPTESGSKEQPDNGSATSDIDPRKRRRPRANNPTYLALLRIDFAALRRGRIEDDEVCEIAGVGPIPVSRARDLLGESVVKLIATKGKQVVNITHYGRKPTVAQRMALLWSQPTCSVLGCNHTFTQTDHRLDWRHTRHTRLDELDRLCSHHHRLKTNHGWALTAGTGKRAIVPPDDPRHPNQQHKPREPAA